MKLTPLNIVLACFWAWAISEMYAEDAKMLFSLGGLLVLTVVLIGVDILFRLWIRHTTRLWIMQVGFMILVGIITILIKTQF